MNIDYVYGAIAGDIAGSTYETTYPDSLYRKIESDIEYGYFTDDTVLTIAVLDAITHKTPMYGSFKKWAKRYERIGFSKNFVEHFIKKDEDERSHSSANGALMMLSPLLDDDNPEKIFEAVDVSHECHEARWLAEAYWGEMKDLNLLPSTLTEVTYKDLLEEKKFCMDSFATLIRAIVIARESKSFEDGIKKAILLGGDTDTQAAVVGPLLVKKFGLPSGIKEAVRRKLTGEMLELLDRY